MSRKDEKSYRSYRKCDSIAAVNFEFAFVGSSNLQEEKNKGKRLKNSAWWRKKIANGICHYCGEKFKPGDLTMDHLVPLVRGGTSERINLVPACKDCNNKKKYLLPLEWEEYVNNIKKK